jgi:hypothetical protein
LPETDIVFDVDEEEEEEVTVAHAEEVMSVEKMLEVLPNDSDTVCVPL